jgi:hypothetical protein
MPRQTDYIEPADVADLLWQAMRSNANPDQRDEAALKVSNYMARVLDRLDHLEELVSDLPSEHEVRDWIAGRSR